MGIREVAGEGRTRRRVHRALEEWLGWTSQHVAGFRSAMLLRAEGDPLRFTSVAGWDDDASLPSLASRPTRRPTRTKDWPTNALSHLQANQTKNSA